MSEKTDLINKMLEMQKKFIAYEQENGVAMSDYYDAPEGHVLNGYRQEYKDIAAQVLNIAHGEKGSQR
ncbi:MAG: hypothetical protein GXP22_09780 [Gammaproteobacteria bacterium]|nr:hypothetical protein [Gammaproteobacteria bacterium]